MAASAWPPMPGRRGGRNAPQRDRPAGAGGRGSELLGCLAQALFDLAGDLLGIPEEAQPHGVALGPDHLAGIAAQPVDMENDRRAVADEALEQADLGAARRHVDRKSTRLNSR